MNSSFLKSALPHLVAFLVFLIVSIVYCKPALNGKVVNQSDMINYKGMAQQSFEYKEKHGHFPLWSESAFGGMPAYNMAMDSKYYLQIGLLNYPMTLWLPAPISFFFLACICFYILTQVLKINSWIGVLSALAYAYSTYDPIIIGVGHVTKMMAIGYAPAVIAALLLLLERKYLLGAALFSVFFSLQVSTQHLQVVYYTMISAGFLVLAYLIYSWQEKQLKATFIGLAIAIGAGIVGFGSFALNTLPVNEYAKETMRGGRTELTGSSNSGLYINNGGLSKEYAFQWSYGIPETITLLVPGSFGGGYLGKEITSSSKFADKLTEVGMPEENALQMANSYAYWGPQSGTAGPVYLGAVCFFLFVLGTVFVKGWPKWWLVSVAITGIVLAWGKSFPTVNNFLFDHLPYYNKFRAPTLSLVMPQFAFPLLGALGLDQVLKSIAPKEEIWKKFRLSVLFTGVTLVLVALFYFSADYKGANDETRIKGLSGQFLQQLSHGQQPTSEMQQQAASFGSALQSGIRADRQANFGSDLVRTVLLIALAMTLLGLYLKGKYTQRMILLGGLLLISSFDLLAVGRRYLNDESFVDASDFEASLAPTAADTRIKSDPEKNFRVLDEAGGDPFQDGRASYYHNSVGGYSPAKMGLYQDLIEHQLSKGNMIAYNMLNTKYFIQRNPSTGQPEARLNPGAYGSCWLVKSIHYVKDGNEEMKALDSINVKDTALIQEKFKSLVKGEPVLDSTASIQLIDNQNDKINYKFSAKTNQFAVFSEIYYDKGWNAFIDGAKADYCRVDYILRGMSVPAGDHMIEFRFEPRSYELGSTLSLLSSIVGLLLLIAAGLDAWRKKKDVLFKS